MPASSVGNSPTGARVRSPVAWVAPVEETKRMKPTDKAVLGMVSESPGRNESESKLASTNNRPRRPSLLLAGEGSIRCRMRRLLRQESCFRYGVLF